jgi:CRP-like cAMP-binding protein
MALANDIEQLSRTRPFNLLPREAIQLIAFSAEKRALAAQESLFEEGDAADSGYFVLSGAIVLSTRGHAGERAKIAQVGALIGENAMVAEVKRPCAARAREKSIVLHIPRQVFHRVLAEFPKEATHIRADLAARLRKISGELEELRVRAIDPVR